MSRTSIRTTTALAAVVTALLSPLAAASAAAQSTAAASLAVTGKVVTPIAVAVTAPLDFGGMFAGTAKTVSPDGTTSGRFNVSGEGGAAISLTLQMPAAVTASGGATIPLSAWTYVMGSTAALTGVTPVNFNGTSGSPISATFGGTSGTSHLYFGVGATATPSASAVGGTYSATGQITVAYVGM